MVEIDYGSLEEWNDNPVEELPPFVGRVPPVPGHTGAVYLAGPILGATYEDARFGWRKYVAEHLATGIKVLSPMRQEGHLAETVGVLEQGMWPKKTISDDKSVFYKDVLDIERCDIVLVNLTGAQRVSIGTCVEIGLAHAKGKKIVVVMEAGNMHLHPFVTEPAMVITQDLDEAIEIVNQLLSDGV